MKRLFLIVTTAVLGLAMGILSAPVTLSVAHRILPSGPQVVHAQWASSAQSVAEQATESDIIVRVQVEKVTPTRKHIIALDREAQNKDRKVDATPFTDTRMRVLEVYEGAVDKYITVMQTGGVLAATDEHPAINLVLEGDPLFVESTEHVLFLKDITGDPIHAKGRTLYRTINPSGRYEVQGQAVKSYAETSVPGQPTTLAELVNLIQQALGSP
jgi:hypothetical protein